jgi:hypothetical protein
MPHMRTSASRVPMWYLPHTRTSATTHASLSAAVYHAPHGGCEDYILIVDIVSAFLPHTRTSATRVPMWYLPRHILDISNGYNVYLKSDGA